MARQGRFDPIFVLFASLGALAAIIRAKQLYGQGTVETVTAVVYSALSALCVLIIVREGILFLKERRLFW